MRILIVLMASVSLLLGCGDDSGGVAGTGGVAGAAGNGGTGGTAATGGVGVERTFIVFAPVPPCDDGTDSDYEVTLSGNAITAFEATFDACTGVDSPTTTTITCANDKTIAYQYVIETLIGDDVTISGNYETCAGQLTTSFGGPTTTEDGAPLVDFFISPEPPCVAGVPSDYRVQPWVEGSPSNLPDDASITFEGCTGTVDASNKTITCNNDGSMSYLAIVREGTDSSVTFSGQFDDCGVALIPDIY